jgi:hypothetical protein
MWSLLRGCGRYQLIFFAEWCLYFSIPCSDWGHVTDIAEINFVSFEQRDAATAPTVGDRVPYVIIKAAKGAKVNSCAFLVAELFIFIL